jgi:hypothetical protein
LAHLLRQGKNRDEEEKREKGSRIDDWQKKGSAFFRQGVLRKLYGCKAAKKKEIEKDSLKVEAPVIFVKENYFGTPLYTMCWINEGGDKKRL